MKLFRTGRKLPIILYPPAGPHPMPAIGIRDVIKYLVGVLEIPETLEKVF
jgi:hypothetical protein